MGSAGCSALREGEGKDGKCVERKGKRFNTEAQRTEHRVHGEEAEKSNDIAENTETTERDKKSPREMKAGGASASPTGK